jgi:hypothetical protein
MYALATTRFNSYTWSENKRWRETNDYKGCIYGTPLQMSPTIRLETTVFMLEMNNDENKIKGVGMVTNIVNVKKYHNIYSNKNYNRYTYKSDYRIDRNEMSWKELAYITILESRIFKTSRHLKRGSGITSVPKRIVDHITVIGKKIHFIDVFKEMFSLRFPKLPMAMAMKMRENKDKDI